MKNLFSKIFKKPIEAKKNESTETLYPDIKEKEFWDIYELCKPYTMTSVERMYALYNAVDHILSAGIEGSFVECGVWRGGSSMLIAKMLSNRKIKNRAIYLYDTFEGMPEPTDSDKAFTGEKATVLLEQNIDNKETSVWCLAGLEDVKNNLQLTGLQEANLFYIKGKVEDTLPQQLPGKPIALLRLDTDWYESTKHELNVLFPLLIKNGVLIIDDYGHWQGCRKAVDEYFTENKIPILLNRIDYTGRIGIKNFN